MKLLMRGPLIAVLVVVYLTQGSASSRSHNSETKQTSTIMGTLLDVNDARVAHAKVKIENRQFKWEGESDEAGDFAAVVPVGNYRIYVNANGFRRFESPFFNAKQNITEMVNLHLEVLTIIDTIEVPRKKKP